MYQFPSAGTAIRGSVTVSHGANVAAHSTLATTVAMAAAKIGDKVNVYPQVAPAAGILVGASNAVTVDGQITINIANVTTATVAAGTAVVYNIQLERPTGQSA